MRKHPEAASKSERKRERKLGKLFVFEGEWPMLWGPKEVQRETSQNLGPTWTLRGSKEMPLHWGKGGSDLKIIFAKRIGSRQMARG